MNQNRLLAWSLIGIVLMLMVITAFWSAAESGAILPLFASVAGMAAIGTGVFHVVSLGLDRIIRAKAHLISEAMASTVSKQVPGGHLVVRHTSVVAQFIPDGVAAQPQIQAPAKRELTVEENNALILIEATINHDEYGPNSGQLISERDARAMGITTTPEQWEIITDWFKAKKFVITSNQGTFFESDLTAWKLWKKLTQSM